MSKPKTKRALNDNEAKAVAKMLRVSPQKLNLVAQLIRGKKVASALADLEFSRKRIAGEVRKTLESAIANAENNHSLDVDDLVVAEAFDYVEYPKILSQPEADPVALVQEAITQFLSRNSVRGDRVAAF